MAMVVPPMGPRRLATTRRWGAAGPDPHARDYMDHLRRHPRRARRAAGRSWMVPPLAAAEGGDVAAVVDDAVVVACRLAGRGAGGRGAGSIGGSRRRPKRGAGVGPAAGSGEPLRQ